MIVFVDVQTCRKIAEIPVSSRKSKYVPRNVVASIKKEKFSGRKTNIHIRMYSMVHVLGLHPLLIFFMLAALPTKGFRGFVQLPRRITEYVQLH